MYVVSSKQKHFKIWLFILYFDSLIYIQFLFKTIFQEEIAGNHDRAINQNGNRFFLFLLIFTLWFWVVLFLCALCTLLPYMSSWLPKRMRLITLSLNLFYIIRNNLFLNEFIYFKGFGICRTVYIQNNIFVYVSSAIFFSIIHDLQSSNIVARQKTKSYFHFLFFFVVISEKSRKVHRMLLPINRHKSYVVPSLMKLCAENKKTW